MQYTIIGQADLAITSADINLLPAAPTEGESTQVTVSVHNLTGSAFAGGGTVGIYDADPRIPGVSALATASLPASIAAGGKIDVAFAPLTMPLGAEGDRTYWVLLMPNGLDNVANNLASKIVSVRDNDMSGPTGTVQISELNGDGDDTIGADELVRVTWTFADPSGVAYVEGYLNGSQTPLWRTASGTGTFDFGPLEPGTHAIEVVAVDGDTSPSERRSSHTFVVRETEEITVLVYGQSLRNGEGAVNFGDLVRGGPAVVKTVRIRNDGQQVLRLLPWSLPSGDLHLEVSGPPAPMTVVPGETVQFQLTMRTEQIGSMSVALVLPNSDGARSPDGLDEGNFELTVTGRVLAPAPVIVLSATDISVPEGGSCEIAVYLSASPQGDLVVSIAHDGDADLVASPSAVVFNSSNWHTPQIIMIHAADDADIVNGTAVFTFAASGLASQILAATEIDAGVTDWPEVEVRGNGQVIGDGDTTPSVSDHTDFGSVTQGGAAVERTFTIFNTGSANLVLGAVGVPAGFTLTASPGNPVLPGTSATFKVRLDTAAAGDKGGQISFATNDSDENPYNFSISGVVTTPVVVGPATLSVTRLSDTGEGQAPGVFRISRDGSAAGPLTVEFRLGGTARLGTNRDYTLWANGLMLTTTRVVIAGGQDYVDVEVWPVDDFAVEPTKTVTLEVRSSNRYRVDALAARRIVTMLLLDNDSL